MSEEAYFVLRAARSEPSSAGQRLAQAISLQEVVLDLQQMPGHLGERSESEVPLEEVLDMGELPDEIKLRLSLRRLTEKELRVLAARTRGSRPRCLARSLRFMTVAVILTWLSTLPRPRYRALRSPWHSFASPILCSTLRRRSLLTRKPIVRLSSMAVLLPLMARRL